MNPASFSPITDELPDSEPKKNEAAPLALSLGYWSHRREIMRSAPKALAMLARSRLVGSPDRGRERMVSIPAAIIRPSVRVARSHRISSSVISP